MLIRPYQSKDKQILSKLFDDFWDYLVSIDPHARLRRLPGFGESTIKSTEEEIVKKDGVFFVAEESNVPIGFISGVLVKPEEQDTQSVYPTLMGRVTELYLVPEWRGKGYGQKLMDEVQKYFSEKKAKYMWVQVFVPNEQAYKLYQKLGFIDRDIDMIKKI